MRFVQPQTDLGPAGLEIRGSNGSKCYDVYDVIQHYVHLSIIRCRIVACRKRPLDR